LITTVNQGIENYKEEVRKYGKWLERLKKRYPMLTPDNAMGLLDNPYYNELLEWNYKLAGMRLALGITKAEDKSIDVECGIAPA
jgi:hypothetical protein